MPLDLPRSTTLCIGDWTVDRASGEMSRGDGVVRLDERALRLLLCLADNAGEVLGTNALLKQGGQGMAWSPDALDHAMASLRSQLGDDPKHPAYIATVPGRGYRLIASVSALPQARQAPARFYADVDPASLPLLDGEPRPARLLLLVLALLALVACLVAIPLFDWYAAAPSL